MTSSFHADVVVNARTQRFGERASELRVGVDGGVELEELRRVLRIDAEAGDDFLVSFSRRRFTATRSNASGLESLSGPRTDLDPALLDLGGYTRHMLTIFCRRDEPLVEQAAKRWSASLVVGDPRGSLRAALDRGIVVVVADEQMLRDAMLEGVDEVVDIEKLDVGVLAAAIDRASLRAQGRAVREQLARGDDEGLACVVRLIVSSTTHPVNNAVSLIGMSAETIQLMHHAARQNTPLDIAELDECVEGIQDGTKRIGERMQRLRRITTLLERHPPTDLSELVTASIEAMSELGMRSFDVELAPGCLVKADPEMLFTCLTRLLAHAVGDEKLTGGSKVRVRTAKDESAVVLEIAHARERVSDPWSNNITFEWIRSRLAGVQAKLELLVMSEEATFRITFAIRNQP